jgi:hypothetical protein
MQVQATGRPSEAGTVAATYLRDGNLALQSYVEAGEWRLALGVVGQLQNDSLLTDTLKPAAAAAAVAMLSDLRQDRDRVDKYWSRLKQLRAKREQMASKVGKSPQSKLFNLQAEFAAFVASCKLALSFTQRAVLECRA